MAMVRNRSSRWHGLALGGLVALGAAVLAGCGQDDSAEEAVVLTRAKLAALTAGGTASAPTGAREAVYREVIQTIRPAARSAAGGVGASAKLVLAEALAGQADLEARRVRDAGARLRRLLEVADNRMDLHFAHQSLAAALAGYDPAADLERVDALTRERTDELSVLQSAESDMSQQVRELVDETERQKGLAEAKRVEAGELQTAALEADPGERSRLVQRAREVTRARELIYKVADDLEAQSNRLAPELRALQAQVDRVNEQLSSLGEARVRIQERAAALASESDGAARARDDAGRQVVEILVEALALTNDELRSAYDTSSQRFAEASREAAGVRRDGSKAASHAMGGSIELSRATLAREVSGYVERLAAALERAGGLEPQIAGTEGWGRQVTELRSWVDTLTEESASAYGSAAEAMSGLGRTARGGAREAIEKVAQRLRVVSDELAGVAPEDEARAPEDAASEPESDDGTAAPEELESAPEPGDGSGG